jgi:23S rRNA U2552 (ribose-2'-O)-methylase RlmE/FtsJ
MHGNMYGRSKYSRTFANIVAQHSALMYETLDDILRSFRVSKIIELGTARGALSVYLGLMGVRSGVQVYTVDKDTPSADVMNCFSKLGVSFVMMDILSQKGKDKVRELIGATPVYLICDNGNKVDEFNSFAPHLCKGSVISAHDWSIEIGEEDIKNTVCNLQLKPFKKEAWLHSDLYFATWSV